MKSKLTTHDIVVLVHELKEKLLGLRVDQVYDVDKKSYLIRFTKTNTKKVLFIESGRRFHTTSFEWPKNPAPSGFTMKMRKHLCNKRLENVSQVGVDRVVDFQFGVESFEFHIFLELYDRGNIILTDQNLEILSLVRPHVQGEDKVAPHQKYAVDKAKTSFSLTREEMEALLAAHPTKSLRDAFLSKIEFGPSLFSFVLKEEGFAPSTKIPAADKEDFKSFSEKLFKCLERGRLILEGEIQSGGFITLDTKAMKKAASQQPVVNAEFSTESPQPFVVYDQFHPALLAPTFDPAEVVSYPTFDEALDEFFSKIESQKIELKQKNQERDALSRLEYLKQDQQKRLNELQKVQEVDKRKAELIMFNQEAVEQAIAIMRQLIANQLAWDDIWGQIKEAKKAGDELAKQITALNLIKNQITMKLNDPYESTEAEKGLTVEIDLDLSAYANASKYFDLKKASAKKEERTLESQEKAFKSTEKKTMSSLREVATIQQIKKVRKVFWFEKFRWFISSENYLVLGGQDAQQNELLVKRYMKPKDVYLHADSHGAPTVIIKNDSAPGPVLPKTLNEAATLAVCASHAWEDKIIPAVWWVWGDQVSKSAPTGEYLPTGSFMIRGKKNFLPPSQLVLGFGFLFRLTDESIPRHANERSRRVQTSSIGESSIRSSVSEGGADAESVPDQEPIDDPSSDSDSEKSNEDEAFPDTKVEVALQVKPGTSRARTESNMSTASAGGSDVGGTVEDEGTVISAGVQPSKTTATDVMKLKQKAKKKEKDAKKKGKGKPKDVPAPVVEQTNQNQPSTSSAGTGNKPKRGQHGRQKKIKEKYRFQDDEERELRMQLLQAKTKGAELPTTTTSTTAPALDKIEETEDTNTEGGESSDRKKRLITASKLAAEKQQPVAGIAAEDEEQVEVPEMETNVLNTLTGAPAEEDELLFAIPVIAPYASLQNYKFRIKMIPGSTKRGKAARSAFEGFLRDKNARPREKDLLKSVKDQDLSRQFPGKVKLAPGAEKK